MDWADLPAIERRAMRQGWRVRIARSGHYLFYAPNGTDIVTCAGTSRSRTGFRNFFSDLVKAGYRPTDARSDPWEEDHNGS